MKPDHQEKEVPGLQEEETVVKKVVLLSVVAALATIAVACGGTSSADKTSTAAASAKPATTATATRAAVPTVAATKAAVPTVAVTASPAASGTSEATPTTAELSADVRQLKQVMQAVIAKAQAGDVQGTRDTEATMDTAMEATVKATRAVDPKLADSLEQLELDIEHQADASTTDLSVIIKDAQAVLPLLDQIVTTLKLTP
jgi:hypothetical protein